MRITFCGAAREVTGSLHLIEAGDQHIALDCGMFQGKRAETDVKNRTFPFDPKKLDAVILSHAHIDHIGRLPLLVRNGFNGTIFSTPATRDLAAVMLADAAHIQEEDAKFLAKKKHETGAEPIAPLYTVRDAADTMKCFVTVPEHRLWNVTPQLSLEYFEAGHMLGSASMRLVYANGKEKVSLGFSGDLGRFNMPILRDPEPLPECDYLICESTYGGRKTESNRDLADRLESVIKETYARGGKVVIPAFSVGRTQVVVYFIHQLLKAGKLHNITVYIDSPLALDATEVFKLHPELFDVEARNFNRDTGDMLGAGCCTFTRQVEDSKRIDERREPCVVISASGMCENGRILHHLKATVADSKNTVLIVGYQGTNTLGRRIEERQSHVRIFGVEYPLRARVEVLSGFSAHADCDELRRLNKPIAGRVKTAFLVHGEVDQMEAMAKWMRADGYRDVQMPEPGRSAELNSGA